MREGKPLKTYIKKALATVERLVNCRPKQGKHSKGGVSMYTIDPLTGYVVAVIDGTEVLFEDLDAYYDYIGNDP